MPDTHAVNLELMTFVEQELVPRYNAFDRAHNMQHVVNVIRRSLDLAKRMGADCNMAYVVAAYHDLGLEGPRAIHHQTSGKILSADMRLKRWFSPAQIDIMRQAVEDHRASASHSPRNMYGMIVAEADRDLEPTTVCRRIVQFGIDRYPEKSREEHWQRFVEHLQNKYSHSGYIKLWVQGSKNEEYLKQLRALINNPRELRVKFDRLYHEEVK